MFLNHIFVGSKRNRVTIYVKFDDYKADLKKINTDTNAI